MLLNQFNVTLILYLLDEVNYFNIDLSISNLFMI